MKTVFSKDEVKQYVEKAYQCMENGTVERGGDIDESDRNELNIELEDNTVYSGNCFDGFFDQINCCRFGNILVVEIQKLGDYDGFYKDWSMKKYMQTMNEICKNIDNVWVSNFEYDDDPMFRAFFISFLFDIEEVRYYEEVYKYCHKFCDRLDALTERKIKGYYWDEMFETDEDAFCKLYLTLFFNKIGFEQVIFNHGNTEFGKDFILITKNIFGEKEYYGVQAKAGNMSGAATSDIAEIDNQINMGFKIPYILVDGTEIYISKMIIAISGNYTNNAQQIIKHSVEPYKFSNIIFLSKKELENHKVMI